MKWSSSSGSLCWLWGNNEWRSCRSLVDIDVHPKDGIGIHPGYDNLWYLHIKEPGYSARWLMLIPYRSHPGSGLNYPATYQSSDGFLCCSSVKVASLPAVLYSRRLLSPKPCVKDMIWFHSTSHINIIQPSTIDLQPSTEPTEEHQTTTEPSEFNPYMHLQHDASAAFASASALAFSAFDGWLFVSGMVRSLEDPDGWGYCRIHSVKGLYLSPQGFEHINDSVRRFETNQCESRVLSNWFVQFRPAPPSLVASLSPQYAGNMAP